MDAMEYKGYRGIVRYSAEDRVLHGRLLGIDDVVNFEGSDVDQHQSYDVSPWAVANPEFRVRLSYQDASFDWYMAVDDFRLEELMQEDPAPDVVGPHLEGAVPVGGKGGRVVAAARLVPPERQRFILARSSSQHLLDRFEGLSFALQVVGERELGVDPIGPKLSARCRAMPWLEARHTPCRERPHQVGDHHHGTRGHQDKQDDS